jgi:hypothetical protein
MPDHSSPATPRLLDQVREVIRIKHYSIRTEQAYVQWIRRYIIYHGRRHPKELGAPELSAFLSALAVKGRVSASTQNQALNAILFLYREVLRTYAPLARGRPARQETAAPSRRLDAGRSEARTRPPGWYRVVDGGGHLWRRLATSGMPAPAGEGPGVQPQRDSGSRRQGTEGPDNDVAAEPG